MNILKEPREKYFTEIANNLGAVPDSKQIVITHFLPDRPELMKAFNIISPIELLIAIPYSIVPEVLAELRTVYNVVTPTLNELLSPTYLTDLIRPILNANKNFKFTISEIGGYFAPQIHSIFQEFGNQIIGFIEDTQNGHVRYEKQKPLPYPVISVARSTLKEGEDTLVGPSCFFSTDKLLRSVGVILSPRRALVVGYGKVGRGMAFSLQDNNCVANVYDINPIRNCIANGDGMLIPGRQEILKECDIIFGCTGVTSISGSDFDLLDDGCILVSCSSKNIEFDLPTLYANFTKQNIIPKFDKYVSNSTGKIIYLLGEGTPINFIDGAVFGPTLTLVQAELILASKAIHSLVANGELLELSISERKIIADSWQNAFIDKNSGSFYY